MNKDEMIKEQIEKMAQILFNAVGDAITFEQTSMMGGSVKTDCFKLAETLYTAGCQKVADDEIVIQKDTFEELSKTYATINDEAYYCGLSVGKEETAREILQFIDSRLDIPRAGIFERKIYFKKGYKMAIQEIKMLIKAEYGIEEED